MAIQIIAIVVPILMAFVFTLVGYSIKQTVGRVNDKVERAQSDIDYHVLECNKIDKAVLSERITVCQNEITDTKELAHWIGDNVMRIAGKLDVRIADRP